MFLRYPRAVLLFFLIISILGGILAVNRIRFSFDLEDFFPDGDDDLTYFQEFRKKFEPDDNFLLVAVRHEKEVFDSVFLNQFFDFSLKARDIPNIIAAQSLLQVEYPLKTPFAFTSIPAIHLEQPELYPNDKEKILSDERLVGTLISEDARTLVLALKTIDQIQQPQAEVLIHALTDLVKKYPLLSKEYHFLGRANFQKEVVESQTWEFIFAVLVSGVLVILVMYAIFRRFWGVVVSAGSILFGLGIFVAYLGLVGARLDTMALLYPIVMIIVATSDIIHVMSKYVDELHKGKERTEAIQITLKEIGMSVFLTSATTAIGFLSLVTSKIPPIRAFGWNAAVGVMLAYLTVVTFTVATLTLFKKEQITETATQEEPFWTRLMTWINWATLHRQRQILGITFACLLGCAWGISKISTNNQIEDLLPKNAKVTEDFKFFEQTFSGFRPLEIAVEVRPPYTADSFQVVQAIDKIEAKLRSYAPVIQSVSSVTMIYKSMNRAFKNDRKEAYVFPDNAEDFYQYQRLTRKLDKTGSADILISKDKMQARISARMLDVGADSAKFVTKSLQQFIDTEIDTNLVKVRQTGTAIIIDKNSTYVRDSLMWGLLFAVGVIALIMMLLYKQLVMVLVALIPNVVPLAFAGAILGFGGIPLEGGVAIVFSIIFGIAVDDTLHFLGRFRMLKYTGSSTDEAIRITLLETGKAMCLTSATLFAGFVVLLFSAMPAANTVGLLISMTLLTALVCDLFLLPVLLRMFIK